MKKPMIITFSGQARHGKDTSVQILHKLLIHYGKKVLIINYTDYLKFVASQYLGWDGNKDEKGRSFLQYLGSEKVYSKCLSFWVDTVIRTTKIIGDDFDYALIGDCRFEHDISRWKEEGYCILPIHVERINFDNELTQEQKNHASEVSLKQYQFAQYISASDLADLEKEICDKIIPLLGISEGNVR